MTAMVVAITRDEARVWRRGLDKGTDPKRLDRPSEVGQHQRTRQAQKHRGHDVDHDDPRFFEDVVEKISDATEILLVGHGAGKADYKDRFQAHLEHRHPEVAAKVVGNVDSDLNALTENQILSLARDWFDQYHRSGLASDDPWVRNW
ncbi:MAG: hypothetical protein ACO39Y_10130 [Ilumatobacteraceae bacterium]|jgi:hypothetical protein|nr:hypothetical protein [Actinomycetota bacterium]MDA3011656.1 hypothetical protein [Actinomycetota bacterium]MDA3024489.1 hypothetical protein [Actinomycetota bacterium]